MNLQSLLDPHPLELALFSLPKVSPPPAELVFAFAIAALGSMQQVKEQEIVELYRGQVVLQLGEARLVAEQRDPVALREGFSHNGYPPIVVLHASLVLELHRHMSSCSKVQSRRWRQ